ncbi:polyprenyl synthetase family protein [Nocardia terpenica]|uniref:polyprenyl synthetase family protein n=1 Tax=Nocardia terpenica TaxID=455432 RepID=UPI00189551E7|nr:polyprenyl synthetase family protein [Nocardia terpenica]MBF6061499.1 polyprenyl synthetase family protein [Nocardia terpenica]MBF6105272.1 polyprenyl synthetase family protein [Nocardia terpenica]MBF6113258.1 polyprenyl synthetase family protein [Nocardia terpenica]MBF6119388.1 polyprenyl synthetase family protein [Nocardia terpenica]MBF6153036.1 polyprenyl synthetase family protein [Nocardia terpenica]
MNASAATISIPPAHRPSEILANSREIVDPGLRTAVDLLPEPLRQMAGYHLGWLDVRGEPARMSAGKLLRPALAICACTACGGAADSAAPAAVAAELIHNFTLIHDDVMDGDTTRRGRPTVWSVWGVSDAVLLGDALHAVAAEVLASRLPATVVGPAVDRLESTVIELCRGQHEDCSIAQEREPAIGECERIAMGKTGALMGCCCALGALCAGADEPAVAAMDRFGRELGMAFQLVDDLIGIWGDPTVSGKPAGDLARRKYTVPVVAALRSGTAAAVELKQLYSQPHSLSAAQIARAAELIESAGGRSWTRQEAERRMKSALDCLPAQLASADLRVLARLVAHRNL